MNTSRLFVLLSVITLLTFLTGCKDSSSPQPNSSGQTSITLALNWVPEPEFGGFYAALEEGFYAKQKLDVTLQPGGAGSPVVQMIAAGKVPLGVVSADEVVIARNRGVDIVAVFAVCQVCPQGIMTHADRGLATLEDVFKTPGTIAMEPGLAYAKFLMKKYAPSDQVKIVPYTGGLVQFLHDQNYSQQCFVFSEPLAAQRQNVKPKTFLVAESGYNPYTVVVATTGTFLKKHPDIVEKFVMATRQGWASYLKDPASANAVMGKLNTTMDAQTFTQAAAAMVPLVQTDETAVNGIGSMTSQRWTTLAQQLVDLKIIDSAPPTESLFKSFNVSRLTP